MLQSLPSGAYDFWSWTFGLSQDVIAEVLKHGGMPAGGAIAAALDPQTARTLVPGDFDIFVENESAYLATKRTLENAGFSVSKLSIMSDTFVRTNGRTRTRNPWDFNRPEALKPVQVIRPPMFKRGQALDFFDFTVCSAELINDLEVVVHPSLAADRASKRLHIVNMQHPLSTLERIAKYVKKGCSIDIVEHAKVVLAILDLPPDIMATTKKILAEVENRPVSSETMYRLFALSKMSVSIPGSE